MVAERVSTLVHQGRLDPDLLAERAVAGLDRGEISLARIADGLEQVAQISAVSAVWPTWVALMDRSLKAPKKPAGLADLFRTSKPYAAPAAQNLGAAAIPESVRALAAANGSTKAAVEARAVVAAVDSASQS